MTAFEIGRLAVKTAGRETAKKCVITGFVDKNFVRVTGAGLSGVRTRAANLKHLVPLTQKVDIKENASPEDVAKAFYGLTLETLGEKIQDNLTKTKIAAQSALQIDELIRANVLENNNPIIDWQFKSNITGKLQIDTGDYFIDEVRDKYDITLSFDEIDELVNKCIEVAKLRYK